MYSFLKSTLLLSVIIGVSFGAKLPEYLKKCKRTDRQCMIDMTNAALDRLSESADPKLKLHKLSEIHVDRFSLQNTRDLSVDVFKATFSYTKHRLTDITFTDTDLVLNFHTDRFECTGDYDINGRILILPIQGKGKINVTFVDFDFEYKLKLGREERKGKTFYKILNPDDIEQESKNNKRIYFHLTNLFNGDKALGTEMNRFLNDNWQEVYQELKSPLEQVTVAAIVVPYVGAFLRSVPIEDMFE